MPELTRQVYRMPKAGSIGHLNLQSESLSEPGPQEVRIAVQAIGLNFADIFAMWGLYSATPQGSFIPGLEYAGVIEAVGPGSTFQVGDRVMAVIRFGGYASHINADQRYVIPLPAAWDMGQGAAFLVQVLTAYYALRPLGDLQQGQTVLVHSAAGGVGLWANRIAQKWGAFTIGSVGRAEKLPLLEKEGYNRGIVRGKDFAEKLDQALDGRELDIVLECIGGKILRQSFEAMAPMGRLIAYGSAQYASRGKRPNYLKLLYYYLQRPKLDIQNTINLNKS